MIKKYIAILFFLIVLKAAFSQQTKIVVNANNQPLNAVLLELRDKYEFQFSYSDNQLSKYKITLSKTFQSKDEAVIFLIKDFPLKLKKVGEVYILIPDKKKEQKIEKSKQTQISGKIVEAGSFEPLPFSHILINNHQMVSDVMGSFNFTASADSSFHVRISHLGYYVYDTVFHNSIDQQFKLIPSTENLPEITVQNNVVEKSTLIGERSGKIKLNHSISRFLPGSGDNSVFNLLRLMPGVQAAGEQSTDLLIWGSYEGQSQITFDEFTVFGLKNYNDNISVVNPFLVKNIEIFKGGYEAKYGNRVGGIVNITGKNGNLQKPTFSFNINPTTINGLIELPLFKKSSLMFAYRQTYYNLYNADDFNIFAPTRPVPKSAQGNSKPKPDFDISVYPDDYRFRDLNLKYTYQADNGDLFFISMYGGGDNFVLSTSTELSVKAPNRYGKNKHMTFEATLQSEEVNKQRGLSLFYSKNWENGSTSKFVVSHSDFSKVLKDSISSKELENNSFYNRDRAYIGNTAIENDFKFQHLIPLTDGNQLELGTGLVVNRATIDTETNLKDTLDFGNELTFRNSRAYFYLQDNFSIGSRLSLKAGARMNYHRGFNRYFFEPRLSSSFKLNEFAKLNASWGVYNQFMYKIANVDRDQNYTYLWVTANKVIPALRGMHWVGGFNYFKNDFTIDVEGYYKTINNISERRFEPNFQNDRVVDDYIVYEGKAKTFGVDTYIKKDFGKHSVWACYTLSKSLESLAHPGKALPDYELAPQDQRHEFKVAGLFNVRNFYLSANYVYGSGMEILREVFDETTEDITYNRVDAAITYKFNFKHVSGETGFSVLNVFDTQNLKHANIRNINISRDVGTIKVYSDAVPFTPILFLKMVF